MSSIRVTLRVIGCFSALHAWHFDQLALKDPDASFERLPSGALRGVCEPWTLD